MCVFIPCIRTYPGPGPARYSLPGLTGSTGHDGTRKVNPAYSFGRRLGTSCKTELFCLLFNISSECPMLNCSVNNLC